MLVGCDPTNPIISVETVDIKPTLPSNIKILTIRLRTGCLTIYSDSLVVKPTPVKADLDCSLATSRESPVCTNAIVAILVMSIDKANMKSRDIMASILN